MGEQYVELVSVLDPEEAAGTGFGRAVVDCITVGDRPCGICAETDHLDAVASRLGLEISMGSRIRPDGEVIAWRGAGLDDPRRKSCMPFFIEWRLERDDLYPGRTPAHHRVPTTSIAWVEVSGDVERLAEWLGGDDLPVRVVDGPPAVRSFAIGTPDGELVID